MSYLGYRWFVFRQWKHHVPDRLAQWVAYRVPRRIALFVFIRVFAANAWNEDPDMHAFDRHCKAWERGEGL